MAAINPSHNFQFQSFLVDPNESVLIENIGSESRQHLEVSNDTSFSINVCSDQKAQCIYFTTMKAQGYREALLWRAILANSNLVQRVQLLPLDLVGLQNLYCDPLVKPASPKVLARLNEERQIKGLPLLKTVDPLQNLQPMGGQFFRLKYE